MSEIELKNDMEAEEFFDELSDEALDRKEGETGHNLVGSMLTIACRN